MEPAKGLGDREPMSFVILSSHSGNTLMNNSPITHDPVVPKVRRRRRVSASPPKNSVETVENIAELSPKAANGPAVAEPL